MNPSNILYNDPLSVHQSATPRRRHPGLQPPSLLTTSLENNARQAHLGLGSAQTPLSAATTTLSSPFSAFPSSQSANPTTATPASSLVSPMHTHQSPSVSTPYNPQQWGPMNAGSPGAAIQHSTRQRLVALAPRLVGPDGTLARVFLLRIVADVQNRASRVTAASILATTRWRRCILIYEWSSYRHIAFGSPVGGGISRCHLASECGRCHFPSSTCQSWSFRLAPAAFEFSEEFTRCTSKHYFSSASRHTDSYVEA